MAKLARICWNTNEWTKPSGVEGKSTADCFEAQCGYGFDEWLFDISRFIDGYHYAFLRPLNAECHRIERNLGDIHLYTISPPKEIQYVGYISDAQGVTKKKSVAIYNGYVSRGWVDEMKSEVKSVGGVFDENFESEKWFNVKFKPENLHLNDSANRQVIRRELIPSTRYKLQNVSLEYLPTI